MKVWPSAQKHQRGEVYTPTHTLGGRASTNTLQRPSLNHERGLWTGPPDAPPPEVNQRPTRSGVWERRFRCSNRDYTQPGAVAIIVAKHLAHNH